MNGLTNTVANLYNAIEPDIRITPAAGKYFNPTEDLLNKIKSTEGVQYISLSVNDKALIKNNDQQTLCTIKGIDENFSKITNFSSAVVEGENSLKDSQKHRIILGRGIADQLKVNMHLFNNELSVFSPVRGKSGSLLPEDQLTQLYCVTTGIFSLNDEFDYQYAFTSIETARKLFDLGDQVSAIEIGCKTSAVDKVQDLLKTKLGDDYTIKNRYELNDALFKALETEKLATFIILAFILVIATFNIIGALTMLIIEKRKDIKTLFSLGADMRMVRNIFMREGFLISGVGAVSGLILGLFVCWLQLEFHLVKFGDAFVIPYYPIELQFQDFINIFIVIMLIGFLAALYPVRVFTKMNLSQ
jgi:lipoprotein-releasing system permease protein